MLTAKLGAILLSVATIIAYVTIQQYKIAELEDKLALCKANNDTYKTTVALRDSTIVSIQASVDKITADLNAANAKNKERAIELATYREELEVWAAKEPEIKYIHIYKDVVPEDVDLSEGKCIDGYNLNRKIEELRFEDL